ncbi:hypothetical protein PZA11_001664 [Diplocarpon coronariae]
MYMPKPQRNLLSARINTLWYMKCLRHPKGYLVSAHLGSLEAEPLAGDAVCGGMSTVRVRGWRLERREAAAIKPGLAIHTTLGLWDKAGLRLQDSCKCRLKDSFSMEISVSPCGQSMQRKCLRWTEG